MNSTICTVRKKNTDQLHMYQKAGQDLIQPIG